MAQGDLHSCIPGPFPLHNQRHPFRIAIMADGVPSSDTFLILRAHVTLEAYLYQ